MMAAVEVVAKRRKFTSLAVGTLEILVAVLAHEATARNPKDFRTPRTTTSKITSVSFSRL